MGPAEDYRVEQGARTAQGWIAVMEAHRRGGDPGLGQIVEGEQFTYRGDWEVGPSLYDYVLEGLLPMPALMGSADWHRWRVGKGCRPAEPEDVAYRSCFWAREGALHQELMVLCYGDSWIHGFQEWRKADRDANGPDDLRQHQREDEVSRMRDRDREELRGMNGRAESSWNFGALGVLDSATIMGRSSPEGREDEGERTQGPEARGSRSSASKEVQEELGSCRSMQWSEGDWREMGTQEDNPFAQQGSQGG